MKCSVIIILYNPDEKFVLNNIKLIHNNDIINEIVLVDNSDERNTILSNSGINKVKYIFNNGNLGIAAAQNLGIQSLVEVEYVVLFDQDSELYNYNFESMLEAFNSCQIKLACLGPRVIDSFSNKKVKPFVQKEKETLGDITLCSQIIASGKMIKLAVLEEVGLFESELFIDGVDHEWCWRSINKGYSIGINENVSMIHTLGDDRFKFFGLTFKVASPIRTYYQFRNILLLSRRDYVPLYWKIRNIISMFVRFIVFGLIHKNSAPYRGYMIRGIIDGIKGKFGAYSK